jgi:chaperonin cofactor prefoldin
MSRKVTFKTLFLISQRDASARKQTLSEQMILLGRNGTGKSRIIKNLFWVFGCNPPKRNVGKWDAETIGALEFSVDDKDYFVLRQGSRLGLFHGEKLLFATQKMGEWDKHIAQLFGYRLKLPRHKGNRFDQAGMEYLTLPFYMDQDGSWGESWDTYKDLGQFKNWKKPTFQSFIGLKPNAYFEAKQKQDELTAVLNEKRKELDAQRAAFQRVEEILPTDVPTLDPQAFRDELAELGRQAAAAYDLQVRTRAKLLAVVSTREQMRAELQLAGTAHKELSSDIVYLSELPSGPIECPTCGVQHENSFHARLTLSQDADTMAALVAELQSRSDQLTGEEDAIRAQLSDISRSIAEFDRTAQERRADLAVGELLIAQSRRTLDEAFRRVSLEMKVNVTELEAQERDLKARVRQFIDKRRMKAVQTYFSTAVDTYSQTLNVPSDERVSQVNAGDRAEAGGSSAPRSMLAVHLGLLATNIEHGDCPLFPFVVDTPQQSGQDEDNLRTMIEVAGRAASTNHQVILAIETLPEGTDVSSFEVIPFEKSHGALSKQDFPAVAEVIRGPLKALNEALAFEGGSRKQSSQTSAQDS